MSNNVKLIPVCVYCDSTDLFTPEEYELENLTDLLFPEHIVVEWFLATNKGAKPEDFARWYADDYTANDTDGLFDFAKQRGFTATR